MNYVSGVEEIIYRSSDVVLHYYRGYDIFKSSRQHNIVRTKMNKVFQIHFSNDDFADLQSELHQIAVEKGYNNRGSIKIEHLDEMIELAKAIAAELGNTATVHVWAVLENGKRDTNNQVEEYEI